MSVADITRAVPGLCPICSHSLQNPTAASSGLVFCYRCILEHVQESPSCPVTKQPCTEGQLRRLYESQ